MPVVPSESTLTAEESAVTLPRYAQIIQTPECAFFGVHRDADADYECRGIWVKHYRDEIQRYLAEAQQEIEQEIGYFLMPRWIVGEAATDMPEYLIDGQRYGFPVVARWGYVVEAGIKATANIQLGAAVDHSADPAIVGPIVTTVTDTSEVKVYHPGTTVEIHPSAITILAGQMAITIPRCRMVKAALADNPSGGLDYTDTNNFEATVDVVREYCDPSTNATLVWPHNCSSSLCTCTCSEYTQDGCIYVRDARIGILDVLPAVYSSGAWSTSIEACCVGEPQLVRLNYRAGVKTLTRQQEDAIVRLAHAKMPEEPCGCEIAQRLWARDREVPKALTRERANCPFGMSDGAWAAWRFAQTFKLVEGMVL